MADLAVEQGARVAEHDSLGGVGRTDSVAEFDAQDRVGRVIAKAAPVFAFAAEPERRCAGVRRVDLAGRGAGAALADGFPSAASEARRSSKRRRSATPSPKKVAARASNASRIISTRRRPRGRTAAMTATATSTAAAARVSSMKGRCGSQKSPPDIHMVQSRASPAKPRRPGAIQRGGCVRDGGGKLGPPTALGIGIPHFDQARTLATVAKRRDYAAHAVGAEGRDLAQSGRSDARLDERNMP